MLRQERINPMQRTLTLAMAFCGITAGSVFGGQKNVTLANSQMQTTKNVKVADLNKQKLQTVPMTVVNPNLTIKPQPKFPGGQPPMIDPGNLQPVPPQPPTPPTPQPPPPTQPDALDRFFDFTLAAMQQQQQSQQYGGQYPGQYPGQYGGGYQTYPAYQSYPAYPTQQFGPLHADADIKKLRGQFLPNAYDFLINLEYKVEVEDWSQFEALGLRMFFVEHGRQVTGANGWPIVIELPLNSPTHFDHDEVDFRGALSVRLPRGSIYQPNHTRVVAEVVRVADGRIADRMERGLSY